jgi:hypothetical protein
VAISGEDMHDREIFVDDAAAVVVSYLEVHTCSVAEATKVVLISDVSWHERAAANILLKVIRHIHCTVKWLSEIGICCVVAFKLFAACNGGEAEMTLENLQRPANRTMFLD